jgi:hypothetical protein
MQRFTKLKIALGAMLLLVSASVAVAFFQTAAEEETAWVCPMHGDYTTETAGKCPRCGMDLVHAAPYDVRDYGLDFRTTPAVPKAGQKVVLTFRITHPSTGDVVKKFETVHERQYHLFVISQDMEHFEHIHPVEASDGTWSIETTLPKAGYYQALSDFMPAGAAPQFLANFHLKDSASGKAIADLQTYLGAFGHTLIMSEDMADYVHSHPLDILAQPDEEGGPPQFLIPPGSDLEAIRGGPDVTFEGLMPRPGMYRAWTQFRRNNKIHTFAFTFRVTP